LVTDEQQETIAEDKPEGAVIWCPWDVELPDEEGISFQDISRDYGEAAPEVLADLFLKGIWSAPGQDGFLRVNDQALLEKQQQEVEDLTNMAKELEGVDEQADGES
jgi:hypothetical protein